MLFDGPSEVCQLEIFHNLQVVLGCFQPAEVTIEPFAFEPLSKRMLMLFLVSGNGVGCAYTGRTIPDHILMPAG